MVGKLEILLVLLLALALSQSASAITYASVNDVYYEFEWAWIRFQARSCTQSDCSDNPSFLGPDNTSGTWFVFPNNTINGAYRLNDTNISANRYFQYKTFLWTDNNQSTPTIYNVSVGYSEMYASTPIITPSPAYSSAQLNCSSTGYKPGGGNFNLTFRWYNGSSLYNETNISSSDGVGKSWALPSGIQAYGETWNCSVRVYESSTSYSDWAMSSTGIEDGTYAGTDDVYYDFLYNYNATNYNNGSILLQVRSCTQSDCFDNPSFLGPDNTSSTWFNSSTYNNLSATNLSDNRYFQWKASLNTTDNSSTPRIFNLSLDYLPLREQLTIELWARGTMLGNHTILERTDSYRIYANDSRFAGGIHNGSEWREIQGNTSLSDSEWYHFILTYSNGTLKLYLNGAEEASSSENGSVYLNSNNIYIGSSSGGGYFSGTIDEIRILDISLSADSVTKSYNFTAAGDFQHHLSLNHYNPDGNITSSATDLGSTSDWRQDLDLSWNEPVPYGEEFDGADSHGIVSYWSFDENVGNTTYDSAGDNDGTMYGFEFDGSSGWATGREGYGLLFGGDHSYVEVSDSDNLDVGSVTVDGWVKPDVTTKGMVAYKYESYALGLWEEGAQFKIYSDGVPKTVTGSALTAGRWYHLLGEFDGSRLRLYIDGVLDSSTAFEGTMDSSTGKLNIGGSANGTCSSDMAYVDKLGGYCIDKYEASCWNADGSYNYTSTDTSWDATDTDAALADGAYAGSSLGKYPWVYISADEARTACSNAGKYLCTSEQWLAAANVNGSIYDLPSGANGVWIPSGAASGDACVTYYNAREQNLGPNNGDADGTGNHSRCVSAEGVYDMTGNVWEWTNETITVVIPLATSSWHYINTTTMEWSLSSSADDGKYGGDGTYFGTAGTRAVLRGGLWGYGAYAGPFCAHLDLAPSHSACSVGFRCCSAPD